MIRPATDQDIPRLVELAFMMHRESPNYRDIPFDAEKFDETLRLLIGGAGVVFVAEKDGVVVGAVGGAVAEFFFSRERYASDIGLFVDPAHRHGILAMKLVIAFKRWAEYIGVKEVRMGITTGIHVEDTARLYMAAGMDYLGPVLSRRF